MTHVESHCERIEHKNEEELEKVGGVLGEACHPICSVVNKHMSSSSGFSRSYIAETMMVGTSLRGTTSKTIRAKSQATGLDNSDKMPNLKI